MHSVVNKSLSLEKNIRLSVRFQSSNPLRSKDIQERSEKIPAYGKGMVCLKEHAKSGVRLQG